MERNGRSRGLSAPRDIPNVGRQQPYALIWFGLHAKCRIVNGKTQQAAGACSDPGPTEAHEIPVAMATFGDLCSLSEAPPSGAAMSSLFAFDPSGA